MLQNIFISEMHLKSKSPSLRDSGGHVLTLILKTYSRTTQLTSLALLTASRIVTPFSSDSDIANST